MVFYHVILKCYVIIDLKTTIDVKKFKWSAYKYGYDYLHLKGKWPYPDEYPIYDFSSELKEIPELRMAITSELLAIFDVNHITAKKTKIG